MEDTVMAPPVADAAAPTTDAPAEAPVPATATAENKVRPAKWEMTTASEKPSFSRRRCFFAAAVVVAVVGR